MSIQQSGTQIVGQYALGLLLEICSHYGHHDEVSLALEGSGQATAKLLNALDMKVLAYDAYQSEAGAKLAE